MEGSSVRVCPSLSLIAADSNGKRFGLGDPAASDIIDGGLWANIAAAKI